MSINSFRLRCKTKLIIIQLNAGLSIKESLHRLGDDLNSLKQHNCPNNQHLGLILSIANEHGSSPCEALELFIDDLRISELNNESLKIQTDENIVFCRFIQLFYQAIASVLNAEESWKKATDHIAYEPDQEENNHLTQFLFELIALCKDIGGDITTGLKFLTEELHSIRSQNLL